MTFVYAGVMPDREVTVPEHIYDVLADLGSASWT
jgi:hypothetical protein